MTNLDKQLLKHIISMVQPTEPNLQKRLISCNMALLEALIFVKRGEIQEPKTFKAIIRVNDKPFQFHVMKQNGLITNVQISAMKENEKRQIVVVVSSEQLAEMMN